MFKWNAETYIEFFTDIPNNLMIFSGWEAKIKWPLGMFPLIIYKKKLVRE